MLGSPFAESDPLEARERAGERFWQDSWLTITPPTPLFFVSVAAKGFSLAVSLLSATLAVGSISVAAKGLTGTKYWQESNGLEWEDFGGARRTTWQAPIGSVARWNRAHSTPQIIAYTYYLSSDYL